MDAISAEEMMRHAPDASRDLASHLRIGVLSLPGVEEACYGDEAGGTYFMAFSSDDDLVLRAYMEVPLRVTLEMSEGEAQTLLDRPDLARTEFRPPGESHPRPLGELIETARGATGGSISIDLVVTSQEDLRAAVRLGHARYDVLMAG